MPKYYRLLTLTFISLLAYFFSTTEYSYYAPQVIAFFSIIIIAISFKNKHNVPIEFLAIIVNIIIFNTNGINSPIFFLIYFFLFFLAFTEKPLTILLYSLTLLLIFAQDATTLANLAQLISIILISPLSYFLSLQTQENQRLKDTIKSDAYTATNMLSLVSEVNSNPMIPYSQKQNLDKVKQYINSLLENEK